jgi:hypothetical protein
MIQDAQGHHLSGATEAAVTAFDQAVRAFNLVHGDSIGLFEEHLRPRPASQWHISEKPGCSLWPMIRAY